MTRLDVLITNVIWAAAWQWLLNNPGDPAWWETSRLVQAMGGLPE